jgi:catechol 2,3-dioxygenase-like lactoylglutathione lyase family enzyme
MTTTTQTPPGVASKASIRTFDHCGFIVEDIPRAHQFYGKLFGAKPLHIANLNTHKAYTGWAIISFVEMGGHRFEFCLAQHPLPPADPARAVPCIGFRLTDEAMRELRQQLGEAGVEYEGPITYPDAIPLKETIRLRDPDGNVLEFSTRR